MPPNAAEVARPKSPLRGILPQSPLRIKQDGKFYERLLAKERSAAASRSFRHYWAAEPGSVPFVWESQPGTPKDVSRMVAGAVPAITPPPSYLLRHVSKAGAAAAVPRRPQGKTRTGRTRYRFKPIKIGFLAGIFRRLTLGHAWRRSAPSVQVSSSSSRWLFSSVATAPEKAEHLHHDPAPRPRQNAKLSTRTRPSPWMLRFRGFRSWSRDDGWA
ncbi:hypothetical protein E2562_006629 [Oryza meyeriana var. granulata]|uniref:Uncharacterized protein n=1 Tax=Oryza meyeriana var. granulata TaxID=110450 RepID=A0A6G1EFW5_9ORYZ|nr:hypothetical protein E2562_006629 [Oryza meyeriana var. granulata]